MPATDQGPAVRTLWHLALGTRALLRGGGAGLDRRVGWVSVLRPTYPLFPDLDRGHLAIASPAVARDLDSSLTLPYLIRALHEAGAAALVVDEAPDDESRALADALALPLLEVPAGTDMRGLERDVLRSVLDGEGYEARRAAGWRQAFQAMLDEGGVLRVVQGLSDDLGVPVQLVDTSGTLLARAEAGEDGCPVLSGEMSAYCVAVTGRALGTLQIAQPARPFPLLPVAAREAADVCALELIQDSIRRETEEQIGAGLVEAILDGSLDTVALTARLARLGYDAAPGRRHAAVALTGTGGVGEAVVRAVESDLRFAGRQGDASVLVLSHEEARLYLVSVAGVTGDARLREWLTTGLATAVQRGCTAGISRCVAGVGDLRLAVQQALATTVMSNRIHGHAGPLFYGDLGLHRLLLGLRDQLEVRRFYEETLSSLVAYDQRHNTELVRTLKAYFEQNGNISETARVLYVHRNTLNYRLQRIAEISGLDLESADTRLALQVALCVHTLSA